MDEPLPELHQGDVDATTIDRLLAELATHAIIDGISAKAGATAYAGGEVLTLADARTLLARRAVAGVQIRYRWNNLAWLDTILLRGEAFRVVRTTIPG